MLPKIEYPRTEVKLLSTGKKVNLRPMTIREEKILLMARESDNRIDIVRAIVQILQACVEGSVKVETLPSYDIEWLFMKLRSQSVSNIVKLNYTPEDSEESYPFEFDLNKIEPTIPTEKPANNIAVNDTLTIHLRHTPVSSLFSSSEDDMLVDVIANSIERIESLGKDVPIGSKEEMREWVQTLPANVMEQIEEFLNAIPTIVHEQEIEVKTDNSTRIEKVRLESIYDFFTL